jgi:hypothetical protein
MAKEQHEMCDEGDVFEIKSVEGGARLRFSHREPVSTAEPIEYFSVHVDNVALQASARVYAYWHPAELFEDLALHWNGWQGTRSFESLERELKLACTHDGLGHILISVDLRSGPYHLDWTVHTAVLAEAGQLERMAMKARAFFGAEAPR